MKSAPSSILVLCLLFAVVLAACDDSAGTSQGGDATTADSTTADATVDVQSDTPITCIPPTLTTGDGNHNAGMDCLSCHGDVTMELDSRWTVAGTLYDTATGTNPLAGATIIVTDADGKELSLVSASNGNFFTTEPVTLPLSVRASACPDDITMSSPATDGSCNTCHTDAMRIHLP